jgi:Tc5 transposase DNA-binding domain
MPQKKTSSRKHTKYQINTRQTIKRKRAAKRKQAVKIKRSSYSIQQKKEVVAYAKQHGRNKAARHFELNGSMVGRWMKASAKWTTETKLYSLRIGSGRNSFFPEAEKRLYNWVIEQRKQGLAVTSATIKVTMFNILEEPDMIALYGNTTESFKASFRWLYGFMKRYKLSLR